ncbi:MAG: Gfo/Idh/MocA family protein [Solirubrobacteraceae bacterium]
MIRIAIVGLGKMGLSHLAIANAHPDVTVAGVCDSSGYVLGILKKYAGVRAYSDYETMLRELELDAIVIATPSRTHAHMVRAALNRGLHVFCEKPFTLSLNDGEELTALARERGAVTQVGYHNRFVGTFAEVKTLLDARAIGRVTHAAGEAYGPVVLRPKGSTWRTRKEEGGGALYDYAAHPLNLLNWYLGDPVGVGGTVLNSIFSHEIDDEVHGTLFYNDGQSARISVNWSDESYRKMTTRITIWGTAGRIFADRQEVQVYLRDTASVPEGYEPGWTVRYTTELTEPVGFYLRGEEYTAQIDHFVDRVRDRRVEGINGFASAAATDRVIAMMIADARRGASTLAGREDSIPAPTRRRRRVRLRALTPKPAGRASGQLEPRQGL